VENKEYYEQAYQNPEFVRVYRETRGELYRRIAEIVRSLGASYALDIGCSMGLLVEYLHRQGISSWGADFDLPQLRAAHGGLSCSGNFFYGDAVDLKIPVPAEGSTIILLDTLRYVEEPERLGGLGAESLIIKEVTPMMRSWRKDENGTELYAPARLARLFPTYRMQRIYASRFLFSISRPSSATLTAFGLMPTYTAVMVRR
jgi:hypothetical protein